VFYAFSCLKLMGPFGGVGLRIFRVCWAVVSSETTIDRHSATCIILRSHCSSLQPNTVCEAAIFCDTYVYACYICSTFVYECYICDTYVYMQGISVIRMYMHAISVIRMYMNAISVILMYYACYICDTYAYRNMAVITAAGSAL